jgi:hypothetical protein
MGNLALYIGWERNQFGLVDIFLKTVKNIPDQRVNQPLIIEKIL